MENLTVNFVQSSRATSKSKLSCSASHSLCGDNKEVPFHLCRKKTALKDKEVSKYFLKGYSCTFRLASVCFFFILCQYFVGERIV